MKKLLLFIIVVMGFSLLVSGISIAESELDSPSQLDEKIDELIKILKFGEDVSVYEPSKQDAVIALGLMKDPRCVDVLIEYLENISLDSLRIQIITSLGWIGDKKALPVLIDILENDDYAHARCTAALALGDIGGGQVVIDALEKAYNNDNDSYVRMYAGMSLEKITGKSYEIETSEIVDKINEGIQENLNEKYKPSN